MQQSASQYRINLYNTMHSGDCCALGRGFYKGLLISEALALANTPGDDCSTVPCCGNLGTLGRSFSSVRTNLKDGLDAADSWVTIAETLDEIKDESRFDHLKDSSDTESKEPLLVERVQFAYDDTGRGVGTGLSSAEDQR